MNPEKPKIGRGQPAGILVVDDTPANLQVLAGMLKDRGYKVARPSGKYPLRRGAIPRTYPARHHYAGDNGYEVCEHLKADYTPRGSRDFITLSPNPRQGKAFATGGSITSRAI